MIRAAALGALERALNSLLSLDPATPQLLQPLAGKSIVIHCREPALDICLHLEPERVRLEPAPPQKDAAAVVSASISGRARDFAALLQAEDPAAELINGPLQLAGDSGVLLALRRVASTLEPDLEAPLARFTGDVIAHQVGRTARGARRHGGIRLASLRRQGSDWLLNESELVPSRDEVNAYFSEVDHLRERSERAAAVLARLEHRLARGGH